MRISYGETQRIRPATLLPIVELRSTDSGAVVHKRELRQVGLEVDPAGRLFHNLVREELPAIRTGNVRSVCADAKFVANHYELPVAGPVP